MSKLPEARRGGPSQIAPLRELNPLHDMHLVERGDF
jgi:hypothetical protein